MPLTTRKSKESFETNLKAECAAGKPKAQALAIAYAQKRKAEKRRKFWDGGQVDDPTEMSESDIEVQYESHDSDPTEECKHDEECEPSSEDTVAEKIPFSRMLRLRKANKR